MGTHWKLTSWSRICNCSHTHPKAAVGEYHSAYASLDASFTAAPANAHHRPAALMLRLDCTSTRFLAFMGGLIVKTWWLNGFVFNEWTEPKSFSQHGMPFERPVRRTILSSSRNGSTRHSARSVRLVARLAHISIGCGLVPSQI